MGDTFQSWEEQEVQGILVNGGETILYREVFNL